MTTILIIAVIVALGVLWIRYYRNLIERYNDKENIINLIYFIFILGLFIIFLISESASYLSYFIFFSYILIFILGFQKILLERWDRNYQKLWKKEQKNIETRQKYIHKMMSNVEKYFSISNCSKCNDNQYNLLEFNSQGNGIHMQCSTCNNKKWFKPNNGFEDGHELIELWNNILYLNEIITTSVEENYSVRITQENDSDRTNYSHKREHIPQNVKDKVWNRDRGLCVECGSNEKLEFDHIIPHSKGGSNTYRNIQLLCEPCNRRKSAKIG